MPRAQSRSTSSPNIEALKDELLLAMLPFVEELGWSDEAILAGAGELGMDESRALTLFPEGAAQLIAHFTQWADRTMVEALPPKKMEKLKIRDRIGTAVRTRLELLEDYKAAVGKAVAYEARPWHAPAALKSLYHTVDAIWIAAGDTSTDFNFYTKRMLLGGVYTSTLLFWLRDTSDGHEATWDFLAKRIENVMQFGKFTGRFKAGVGKATDTVKKAANKVRSHRAA